MTASSTPTGYFRGIDARDVVGISRSTLYRMKQQGLIQPRKVGGMSFFSVAQVKSIIEGVGDQVGDQKETSEIPQ